MRTRSHPVSPGGLVSLDDVPARRRRNTRSVSAQPQDAEPGSGADEASKPKPTPKPRRARAKSTRGKKKTSRRPTKSAEQEQRDAAAIAAEEVGQDDVEMVGSPQVAIDDEHVTPLATITEDPAAEAPFPADLMQGVENVVPTISEIASPAQPLVANIGDSAMEIDHPGDLMQDFEDDDLPLGSELLIAFSELSADQLATEQSHEDHLVQDEPTSVIPSIENSHPVFASVETGDVEYGTDAGAAAQRRNLARRTLRISPPRRSSTSQRATEGSQVLRPQKATPIRRSYSNISHTRRTEANGRINRTLYRLPDLLTQNDSDGEAPAQDRHQVVETQENVSVIADPSTPEAARPSTPMTAPPATHVGNPAASPNASPSWSRWIFNNVSRRWTNIRERLVPRPTVETHSVVEAAEAIEAAEAAEQQAAPTTAPTTSAETNVATVAVPDVPAEAFAPLPVRSTYRVRRSSFLPRDQPASRTRRPRRISTTDRPVAAPKPRSEPTRASTDLGYDLFPRGFDPELIKRCFARGTNPRLVLPSQTAETTQTTNEAAISAPNEAIPGPNEATPTSIEDQSLKRKREEPETIPNPKGCSYGMDEEYFGFTDAEWDEEDKRLAALEAKEMAQPATKKQRVDALQPRRRATTRPNAPNAPLSAMSPSRRPGFVPNRRGTYAAPDLSPIDSSGLMSGTESSPIIQASSTQPVIAQPFHKSTGVTQTPQPQTPQPQTSQPQRAPGPKFKPSVATPNSNDVPESRETAPTATQIPESPAVTTQDREASNADTDTDADADGPADGPSPLTRARNKAEQFKPKTPSRLREAHPFASSIASTTTASPSFLGVTTGTPSNFGATMRTPSDLGVLTSPPLLYSDEMSIDTTLEPVSPGDDAKWLSEVCPSGDINELGWPKPASLIEILGIDPAAAEIVNQNVDPKKDAEALEVWQTLWEEFQRGELVF